MKAEMVGGPVDGKTLEIAPAARICFGWGLVGGRTDGLLQQAIYRVRDGASPDDNPVYYDWEGWHA